MQQVGVERGSEIERIHRSITLPATYATLLCHIPIDLTNRMRGSIDVSADILSQRSVIASAD